MQSTGVLPRLLTFVAMSGAFALMVGSVATTQRAQPPLREVSCFTIGAVVECIDSGFIMPPMIIAGTDDEGTNETFIIEDNGGYHEVHG